MTFPYKSAYRCAKIQNYQYKRRSIAMECGLFDSKCTYVVVHQVICYMCIWFTLVVYKKCSVIVIGSFRNSNRRTRELFEKYKKKKNVVDLPINMKLNNWFEVDVFVDAHVLSQTCQPKSHIIIQQYVSSNTKVRYEFNCHSVAIFYIYLTYSDESLLMFAI